MDKLLLKVDALQSVLNEVGAYIYTKDVHGSYTFCNQPFLKLFNKRCDQVIGKKTGHFFDLTSTDKLCRNDQKVMRENLTLETVDLNGVKGLAENRIFKTIKKPLHDKQGKVIGMCGISTDITDQKKQDIIIKEQKHLLDAVLDNVDAHIYMKDSTRNFRYVNRKTAEFIGLPADQISGKKDTELFSQKVADSFWVADQKVLDTQKKQTVEERFINAEGITNYYHSVKIPYQIDDTTSAVIGFSTDMTEFYKLKEALQKQANTDFLTELNNRRYFVDHAEREYFRAQRHKLSMAVITLDIDNFKLVNDSYGHPVGDQVLIALSTNLAANVRSEDILSRTGGEEFSICLPETNSKQAMVLAERIRSLQEKQIITSVQGDKVQVTISIGIATFKPSDSHFDMLFSRADKALYRAKNSGKNRICVAD
ncbi:sensor domain-containing diguanylate cyclase [Psychromonas antarctica]|uniref:sensor domain-containing diguanylate cyclase n=1 Tax=Psychromonas antarctica TaxID=67573 RepID=UPI001EE7A31F|nr:diguanylate cyclase [Psychromonas antarctica]